MTEKQEINENFKIKQKERFEKLTKEMVNLHESEAELDQIRNKKLKK